MPEPLLTMSGVSVWTAEGAHLLHDISWRIQPGEQWAMLGPNGAGKSTLLGIAGATRHPSAGAVTLLGGTFGSCDMRALRAQVGMVEPTPRLLDWLTTEDVVVSGLTQTIRPHWERVGPVETARMNELLHLFGCAHLAQREIRTCSQGERQRLRIVRALMPEPRLLLLDEPATGLDLPAREALLAALTALTLSHPCLATVTVSHHLEDLSPTTTHALLLRAGRAVAQGPIEAVLTPALISDCFGIDVVIQREGGRWFARAAPRWN